MLTADPLTCLPCPVCGREPKLSDRAASPSVAGPGREWFYFAACYDGGNSAHVHAFGYSPEERAAKWNRRAMPPAPAVDTRLLAAAKEVWAADKGTVDPRLLDELEDAIAEAEHRGHGVATG